MSKEIQDISTQGGETKGKVSKEPNAPSLEYEDPINEKYTKTIEVSCDSEPQWK